MDLETVGQELLQYAYAACAAGMFAGWFAAWRPIKQRYRLAAIGCAIASLFAQGEVMVALVRLYGSDSMIGFTFAFALFVITLLLAWIAYLASCFFCGSPVLDERKH